MKLSITNTTIRLTREAGDPKFYGIANAAGESKLFHYLKKHLNQHGILGGDFIKKRMWKDGHLVDDMQQYLRSRKECADGGIWCIYNASYAIRGAEEDWNRDGEVVLSLGR
jgi:hypothetical protein